MKAIGKYHLQQKLGAGYFGTTYLARDTVSEVDVALKLISKPCFNKDWFKRGGLPVHQAGDCDAEEASD